MNGTDVHKTTGFRLKYIDPASNESLDDGIDEILAMAEREKSDPKDHGVRQKRSSRENLEEYFKRTESELSELYANKKRGANKRNDAP